MFGMIKGKIKKFWWETENLKKLNRNSRTVRYSNLVMKLMDRLNGISDITEERISGLKGRLEKNKRKTWREKR